MFDGWKILFQDVYVDDIIKIVGDEATSFTKEDNSRSMGSSNQTKRDS